MKHIGFAILCYSLFVLQASIGSRIAVYSFTPNLLLVALALAILSFDGWRAVCWAAAAGFLCDCLTGDRMGVCLASHALIAIAFQWVVGRERFASMFVNTLLMFLIVFAGASCLTVSRELLNSTKIDLAQLSTHAAGMAGYSTAIGIVLMGGWRILAKRFWGDAAFNSTAGSRRWRAQAG